MAINRRLIKNKVVAVTLLITSALPIIFEKDVTFFVIAVPISILLFVSKKNHIC